MAVPKRRQCNARTGTRRAHDAKKPKQFLDCPQCSTAVPSHVVCPNCGHYMGRKVVETESEAAAEDRHLEQDRISLSRTGGQTVGMGKRLAESLPRRRRLYDRAGEVLGYDLAKLCFEGPAEQLDSTVYSQPALFVTSLAALEALRAESPDVVLACEAAAGLSLGEYTAMVFAGVMEFEDGLTLVQQRGAAMQEASDATPSGMVSILGLERVAGRSRCARRSAATTSWKSPTCSARATSSFRARTRPASGRPRWPQAFGAMKAVPLAVAGAFHTPIMRPADERLAEALAGVPMHRPRIPVDLQRRCPAARRSGGDPPAAGPADPRTRSSGKTRCGTCSQQGFDQFYEVGPGPRAARAAAADRPQGGVPERGSVEALTERQP